MKNNFQKNVPWTSARAFVNAHLKKLLKSGQAISDLEKARTSIIDFFFNVFEGIARTIEKSYGGCQKCYGKGYSTRGFNEVGADDFGGEGYAKIGQVEMRFCSCDRGKQLGELLKSDKVITFP